MRFFRLEGIKDRALLNPRESGVTLVDLFLIFQTIIAFKLLENTLLYATWGFDP